MSVVNFPIFIHINIHKTVFNVQVFLNYANEEPQAEYFLYQIQNAEEGNSPRRLAQKM